ncbi:hypothetical protein INT80_02305 [Gallibacterium anatis]|uniref:Uncharacterized protein n=1 Tax=Gallibacterium anatis TaxID=750 RepID=A0A930UWZ2_9PAST|nr:hypothetical protein [Gallibacterium anatis]
MLNWSAYLGQKYDNTNVEYLHLGGSYPSNEVDKQSREYLNVNTQYLGVEGDIVYEGMPFKNLGLRNDWE